MSNHFSCPAHYRLPALVALAAFAFWSAPSAFAQASSKSIGYKELTASFGSSKSVARNFGKTITLNLSSDLDENYFWVNQADRVYFECRKSMLGITAGTKLTKVQVTGVLRGMKDVDDAPVFQLDDCRTGVADPIAASATNQTRPAAAENFAGKYRSKLGEVEFQRNANVWKFSVDTSSPRGGGTCSMSGKAVAVDINTAVYKDSDDACVATFRFDAQGVKVSTQACFSSWCGATAPGLDGQYARR